MASTVLIIYWDTTYFVYDGDHSVILFVCAFLLSIVDCLSSITFLPFMSRFPNKYLTPYLIGEGLSGFLPMILSLAQNYNEVSLNDLIDNNISNNNLNISSNLTNFKFKEPIITNSSLNLTKSSKKTELKLSFGPNLFFISLLVTIVISWYAFFYLQFNESKDVSF